MKTLLNGWTKAKIMAKITRLNKGKCIRKGSENVCLYRGPNKNRCLFGALIPDRLYKKAMEEKIASYVMTTYPELASKMPFDQDDADRLQSIHDEAQSGIRKKELHENVKEWLDANFKDAR